MLDHAGHGDKIKIHTKLNTT